MTKNKQKHDIRGIQVLRNVIGVFDSGYFSSTKMYDPTLLALRGVGCEISNKKMSRNT